MVYMLEESNRTKGHMWDAKGQRAFLMTVGNGTFARHEKLEDVGSWRVLFLRISINLQVLNWLNWMEIVQKEQV